MNAEIERIVTESFHRMYYHSDHTWNEGHTRWMGIPCFQNPMDMWTLSEIIFELRPTVIIETGTWFGGSALFFAHVMDNAKIPGVIFTIDIEEKCILKHPKVLSFVGKSTSEAFLNRIKSYLNDQDKVMVFLDSDHTTENVIEEMKTFAPFVTKDQYMVVCDSNLGGNPIENISVPGPGPMKAIEMFMKENGEFEIDRNREKFFFTFCPSGFLRRVK